MAAPVDPPLGLSLFSTSKAVSRAFDAALSAAGGSRSTWMILLALKTRPVANQRELADAIGIRGATLTHHLSAVEADGLLTRRRDPENRRIHIVELTDDGETMFHQLRKAAQRFDETLRAGLSQGALRQFRDVLGQLEANVKV